jgi:hypothetical protein
MIHGDGHVNAAVKARGNFTVAALDMESLRFGIIRGSPGDLHDPE